MFRKIPKYMKYKIANYLDYYDLITLFNVDKMWYNMSKCEDFWKNRILKLLGKVPGCIKDGNYREWYENNMKCLYKKNRHIGTLLLKDFNTSCVFLKDYRRINRNGNVFLLILNIYGDLMYYKEDVKKGSKLESKFIDENVINLIDAPTCTSFLYINKNKELILNVKGMKITLAENSRIIGSNQMPIKRVFYYISHNILYRIENLIEYIHQIEELEEISDKITKEDFLDFQECVSIGSKIVNNDVKIFIHDYHSVVVDKHDNLLIDGNLCATNVKNLNFKRNISGECNILYVDMNDSLYEYCGQKNSVGLLKKLPKHGDFCLIANNVKKYHHEMGGNEYILYKNGDLYMKGFNVFDIDVQHYKEFTHILKNISDIYFDNINSLENSLVFSSYCNIFH